jgi:SNF2 family DNA or RNA helicase
MFEFKLEGPFLIVVPATTLYNWMKEFKRWADKFNVVVYTGNQESRKMIRQREFYYR